MLGRDPIQEGPLLRGPRRSDPNPESAKAGPEAHDDRPPARRRRRLWLGASFLAALVLLLGLNVAIALSDGGRVPAAVAAPLRSLLNGLRGPVRIGLQVGHLDAAAAPKELAKLRALTGATVDGVEEVDVNHAIVRALAARLRHDGFEVDVLDTTVPVHYRADLVLAVHADANADPTREGYKSAHFLPLRNPRDPLLKLDIDRAVLYESGLGDDDRNVSIDMLKYYAFNARRFRHALARRTPGLIVEMGYLSNAHDRAYLERPDAVAKDLEDGILAYLRDVGRIPPAAPSRAGRSR